MPKYDPEEKDPEDEMDMTNDQPCGNTFCPDNKQENWLTPPQCTKRYSEYAICKEFAEVE